MGSTRSKVGTSSIIPEGVAEGLDRLCPDLAEWPLSWQMGTDDIPIGQCIIETLKPFLYELLRQELTHKTFARHRDHVWMLGGEIIRRRHENPKLCKQPVTTLLSSLIEEDGGPLLWPHISESAQNSFDATCRKLYRFLQQSKTP